MKRLLLACLFIPVLLLLPSGCSIVGIRNTEEPNYKVVKKDGPIEIRQYKSYIIAETSIANSNYKEAGNKAFRILFNYISGQNIKKEKIEMTAPVLAEGEKIDMTAPVIQQKQKEKWNYAFVLPLKYTMTTAPLPTSDQIQIKEVQGSYVAVIRYSGTRSIEGYQKHTEKLKSWLKEQNIKMLSEPRSAAYDPPWTVPALRRNEVMLDIDYSISI